MISKKVIVALDSSNFDKSLSLVKTLKKDVYAFKIGYEFFLNFGLSGYKKIYSICPKIFLDLKLHDIPNTVQQGIKALSKIKPLFSYQKTDIFSRPHFLSYQGLLLQVSRHLTHFLQFYVFPICNFASLNDLYEYFLIIEINMIVLIIIFTRMIKQVSLIKIGKK